MNEDVKSENLRIHSRADELIACLEGEIARRGARIVELESGQSADMFLTLTGEITQLRAELAALKAQEPVARLPACPSRAFAVANLRDLAQSVLQHDPDVGMFRDEDQAFLINELADLAESFNGDVKLYAAPVSEAKAQGVVMPEGWIPLTIEHEPGYPEDVAFGPKRMMDRLKKWLDRYFEMRLNAAHAQQVIVPDDDELSNLASSACQMALAHGVGEESFMVLARTVRDRCAMLAAPAAPAADAGLVEALALCVKSLDQLLPYLGKVPADIGLLNDALMAARPSLAAHRAQGVV